MPHTISVNFPNLPSGAEVVTPFGGTNNGSPIVMSDEQVAVWQAQNPGQTLPTSLDNRASDEMNAKALADLRELNPEQAEALEASLEAQKGLDLSTSSAPPEFTTMAPKVPELNKDGDS